jgi:NitT/TauT family transport system substrate-binding protein
MVYMMADELRGIDGYGMSFTVTNDSDVLVAALFNQEPDFAIVPVNVAAMMHTNGSGYRLAAVTTWGIMHIVSDNDIQVLEDLIGETILVFGRSGTPGITLRTVLRQNGIPFDEPSGTDFTPNPDRVSIVYLTAASDVRDAIATGMNIGGKPASFGLLAEPVATAIAGFAANMGRPGFTPRINLQTEWAAVNGGVIYPQAVLIFHERLLAEHEGFVNDFIALAEASSIYANQNPAEAGNLAVTLGSTAIPNGAVVAAAHGSNRLPMHFTHAADARQAVETFLQAIMHENANLIGGRMPSDNFYYEKN